MLKEILVWLGGLFLILIAVCLFIAIYAAIAELIDKWKYNYRIKHRFDKPPMAPCHCVDCKHYSKESGRCYAFERQYVADSWFCWKAEPTNKKENS